VFLDTRQIDGAISARARQNDAERALSVYFGQIAEEQVNGRVAETQDYSV
jgi:hypothetical protein